MSNLTIKQRKFIAGVATGLPKRTAAIQAGYSPQSAHSIANETINNPEVLRSLHEIMEEQGITDFYIASKLAELAEAETKGIPQWPARARALDMMLKVKGCYAQEQAEPRLELSVEQAKARLNMLLPNVLHMMKAET